MGIELACAHLRGLRLFVGPVRAGHCGATCRVACYQQLELRGVDYVEGMCEAARS